MARYDILKICLLASVVFASAPANAEDQNCSKQVTDAFDKQRKLGVFRMKTTMINDTGVLNMTVDYQLPGRMHQTVKRVTEPTARETVLVGDKAWTRQGGGWNEVPAAYVEQLVKQLNDTVVSPPKDESFYACDGKATIDGQELLKFRGYETIRVPDKDSDKVARKVVKRDGAPVRYVYLDPDAGLPVRNTVATANRPDRPFFKTVFSYPSGLKVKAPTSGVRGQ